MKRAEVRRRPGTSGDIAAWRDLRVAPTLIGNPPILPTGHVYITENQVVVSAGAAVRLLENDARRPIYPI